MLAQVTGVLNSGASGDQLFVKLRNTTTGTDIGDPAEFCYLQQVPLAGSGISHETATLEAIVTVAAGDVIALQGKYVAVGVPTAANLASLRMSWIKLA